MREIVMMSCESRVQRNPLYIFYSLSVIHGKQNCNECGKTITNNSTNLEKHLRTHKMKHAEFALLKKEWKPKKINNVKDPTFKLTSSKQPTLQGFADKQRPWDISDPKQEACVRSLAQLIIEDAEPFRIVERDGFRRFVNSLQPRFQIPGRRALKDSCIKELVQIRAGVRLKLSSALAVAITEDGWTTKTMLPMLGVTVHFISES